MSDFMAELNKLNEKLLLAKPSLPRITGIGEVEKYTVSMEDVKKYTIIEPQRRVEACPSHTRSVFDAARFPMIVDWIITVARMAKYEALAACGHSGLIVAGAAAYVLRIPVIAVRKEDDRAKGDPYRKVNVVLNRSDIRYAFVDDLIARGDTFGRVVTFIEQEIGQKAVCAGIILYNGYVQTPDTLKDLLAATTQNDPVHRAIITADLHMRPRTANSDFKD